MADPLRLKQPGYHMTPERLIARLLIKWKRSSGELPGFELDLGCLFLPCPLMNYLHQCISQAPFPIRRGDEEALQEGILSPQSPLVSKTMAEAQSIIFNDGITMIALKKRTGSITGPRPQNIIEAGDTVIVVGTPETLADFKKKNSEISTSVT